MNVLDPQFLDLSAQSTLLMPVSPPVLDSTYFHCLSSSHRFYSFHLLERLIHVVLKWCSIGFPVGPMPCNHKIMRRDAALND